MRLCSPAAAPRGRLSSRHPRRPGARTCRPRRHTHLSTLPAHNTNPPGKCWSSPPTHTWPAIQHHLSHSPRHRSPPGMPHGNPTNTSHTRRHTAGCVHCSGLHDPPNRPRSPSRHPTQKPATQHLAHAPHPNDTRQYRHPAVQRTGPTHTTSPSNLSRRRLPPAQNPPGSTTQRRPSSKPHTRVPQHQSGADACTTSHTARPAAASTKHTDAQPRRARQPPYYPFPAPRTRETKHTNATTAPSTPAYAHNRTQRAPRRRSLRHTRPTHDRLTLTHARRSHYTQRAHHAPD